MDNMSIFPENFSLSASGRYHLSMQWSVDAFYYTILDIAAKKYLGIKKHVLTGDTREQKSLALKEFLQKDELFNHTYESSSLMMQSYKAMLVPESLFDSNNLNAFLKFHHEIDDKDHIHSVPVKSADAFIVFSVPSYIEDIIEKVHPHVKYSHHSHPMIEVALKGSNETESNTHINLNFGKDFFDVLITRNKKILLFNSFFYQKHSDVVYFVVNILNLFSLQPDHTKINISGWVKEKSEIEPELKKLFKNLSFAQFSLDFNYFEKMYTIPQQNFVNLLNLYHCEL